MTQGHDSNSDRRRETNQIHHPDSVDGSPKTTSSSHSHRDARNPSDSLIIQDQTQNTSWLQDNRAAWDAMAQTGHPLARPADDKLFDDPLRAVDAPRWLGNSIRGQRVLCLAAGGGRQGPLYAAAGADVTVVDISQKMLQLDQQVANARRLNIKTVQSSMENLQMFDDGQFDLVIQPVSTCYVPNVIPVYRQVARVLRNGGVYISQHKQPASLQASLLPTDGHYTMQTSYYHKSPLPTFQGRSPLRETGAQEFLHRWEQLIGGMCQVGLRIEALLEPRHADPHATPGTLAHRSHFLPPYVRVKARK